MNTLSDIRPGMKNVILRVDWNIPIQNGKILDNSRILETIPTIQHLLAAGKHVTLLTHLGRPNAVYQEQLSLKFIVPEIERLLSQTVYFIKHLDDMGSQWTHPLSLVENIRFFPGEAANDSNFAAQLTQGADVYVNDAFSVSHRSHASVEAITHVLPSFSGLLMERELSRLIHFKDTYVPPLMAICGGAKISSKIDFIYNMMKKAKTIAIVGGLANTFLKAKGINIGLSLVENDALDSAKKIISEAETVGCQLWLPQNVRVGKTLNDIPADKHISEIQPDDHILDIAPRSLECLLKTCKEAKTIIWNGALGIFEYSAWSNGTFALAGELGRLTQQSQCQTLAGGGETVMALHQTNTFDQFTYISLAGGAFMEFMEGKELPGIKPLL